MKLEAVNSEFEHSSNSLINQILGIIIHKLKTENGNTTLAQAPNAVPLQKHTGVGTEYRSGSENTNSVTHHKSNTTYMILSLSLKEQARLE